MDAKYVGLLSMVQDKAVKAVLKEIINDMGEKRVRESPLSRLGYNLEIIEKLKKQQKDLIS